MPFSWRVLIGEHRSGAADLELAILGQDAPPPYSSSSSSTLPEYELPALPPYASPHPKAYPPASPPAIPSHTGHSALKSAENGAPYVDPSCLPTTVRSFPLLHLSLFVIRSALRATAWRILTALFWVFLSAFAGVFVTFMCSVMAWVVEFHKLEPYKSDGNTVMLQVLVGGPTLGAGIALLLGGIYRVLEWVVPQRDREARVHRANSFFVAAAIAIFFVGPTGELAGVALLQGVHPSSITAIDALILGVSGWVPWLLLFFMGSLSMCCSTG